LRIQNRPLCSLTWFGPDCWLLVAEIAEIARSSQPRGAKEEGN
jgi:hypothetical protein